MTNTISHSSGIMHRNNINIVGNTTGGGDRTIILAHGFGSDQTAWRHQVAAFAPDYRIVLFDHVGAGKSDLSAYSPHRYRSIYSYSEDLLDICSELSLSDCILVGHSVSGMVGLLASLIEPFRFKKLIFISASPRYLNDVGYVGGFEQSDLDTLYASMASNYYAWASGFAPIAMGNPDRPELGKEFASTLAAIRPDIAQAVARVIFQSDHRAELPRVTIPTVVLQASNDIAVPVEVGRYLANHISDSQLIHIAATGHLPHLSAPDVVTQAIAACLSA